MRPPQSKRCETRKYHFGTLCGDLCTFITFFRNPLNRNKAPPLCRNVPSRGHCITSSGLTRPSITLHAPFVGRHQPSVSRLLQSIGSCLTSIGRQRPSVGRRVPSSGQNCLTIKLRGASLDDGTDRPICDVAQALIGRRPSNARHFSAVTLVLTVIVRSRRLIDAYGCSIDELSGDVRKGRASFSGPIRQPWKHFCEPPARETPGHLELTVASRGKGLQAPERLLPPRGMAWFEAPRMLRRGCRRF